MSGNDYLFENLEATLDKAERYVLISLFSSVAFLVLSLPEVQIVAQGEGVKWTLLGFSLNFDPRLALMILYAVFLFCFLLADNMIFHIRDLVTRINDMNKVREVLTHPTILTVSPIGQFVVTVIPSVLVCLGITKNLLNGGFQLHWIVWCFVYGFGGLVGVLEYSRVLKYISTYQKEIKS